jgi:hypothetical protein
MEWHFSWWYSQHFKPPKDHLSPQSCFLKVCNPHIMHAQRTFQKLLQKFSNIHSPVATNPKSVSPKEETIIPKQILFSNIGIFLQH